MVIRRKAAHGKPRNEIAKKCVLAKAKKGSRAGAENRGNSTVIVQKERALENQGLHVRETGLEPASTYVHMNLNHARLPIPPFPQGVGRGGFEPPKLIAADLQSAPFGHSGTYPHSPLEYPVLLRPSYVLGGQNMIIAFNDEDVNEYMRIILGEVAALGARQQARN